MIDRLITADARTTSGVDFLRQLRGLPPLTTAERVAKEREAAAVAAARRAKARAELEQVRENLCRIASPALAAKFRAQWAEQDAVDAAREQSRKAA